MDTFWTQLLDAAEVAATIDTGSVCCQADWPFVPELVTVKFAAGTTPRVFKPDDQVETRPE